MKKKRLGVILLAASVLFGTESCGKEIKPEEIDARIALEDQKRKGEAEDKVKSAGDETQENDGSGNSGDQKKSGLDTKEAGGGSGNSGDQEKGGLDAKEAGGEVGNPGDKTMSDQEIPAGKFRAAKNYREILEILEDTGKPVFWETYDGINYAFNTIQADSITEGYGGALDGNIPSQDDNEETFSYSGTNVQVEGIAESDIVKTDGKFIYILSLRETETPQIHILRARDGEMEKVSSFALLQDDLGCYGGEMYVSGDKLVVVRQGFEIENVQQDDTIRPQVDYYRSWYRYGEDKTQILIYDITDRTNPVLAAVHKQDGRFVDSREKDGYLYVVSEKNNWRCWPTDRFVPFLEQELEVPDETEFPDNDAAVGKSTDETESLDNDAAVGKSTDETEFLDNDAAVGKSTDETESPDNDAAVGKGTDETESPDNDAAVGKDSGLTRQEEERLPKMNGCLLPADAIYYDKDSDSSVYTIVTSICLDQPDKVADSISVMTESDHCYVSNNAIYLTAYSWEWQNENSKTALVKIGYTNGMFELLAQGIVKGNLDGQFSMDEKDGYLRLVTTVDQYRTVKENDYDWQEYVGRTNSLYVLDKDLQVIGELEGLAEEEEIYSARFIGDIAYFVTYRNTDPLFSVDLTDPTNPTLLGALKIPGFSDYLHPYGDHLLLGVGYDAGDTGEETDFIKLTMFDISDPANVVEKHTLILDGYDGSEACYNHKSVLVDAAQDMIGLPVEGYRKIDGYGGWDQENIKAYLVYGYDEKTGFKRKLTKEYTWKYPDDSHRFVFLDAANNMVENDSTGGQEVSAAEDYNWNTWYDVRLRGLYIGDDFYVVNTMKEVSSYQIKSEEFIETGMVLCLE